MVPRAETDNPRLMQEHARQEQEIIMQACMLEDSRIALQNLADSHWIVAQQSELVIRLTTQWLKHPKDDHSTLVEFLRGQVPDQIQRQYAAQHRRILPSTEVCCTSKQCPVIAMRTS